MSASFTRIRKDARFSELTIAHADVANAMVSAATFSAFGSMPTTIATQDTAAVISAAQMFGTYLVSTPGAAINLTTRTAAEIIADFETQFGVAPVAGDSWDLFIINAASVDTRDITLVAGTKVAITGQPKVAASLTDESAGTSGHFKFVIADPTGDAAQSIFVYRLE